MNLNDLGSYQIFYSVLIQIQQKRREFSKLKGSQKHYCYRDFLADLMIESLSLRLMVMVDLSTHRFFLVC